MKKLNPYLTLLLFLAMTFIIYSPAIEGEFIWDDDDHLYESKPVTDPEGLRDIWFTPGATVQYYPLVFSSFWLEYRIWGDHPKGYHIINLVLHATSAFLLWRVLWLLAIPGARLAAFIFLIHPVNVESVAWIAERKNALSAVFYFASLISYLKFIKINKLAEPIKQKESNKTQPLFYVLSLIIFLMALFSKTATCTLPAVILLIIWWKKNHLKSKDILLNIPFLILTFLMARLTIATENEVVGIKGSAWDYTFAERFIIAGKALWFYLYKIFYPLNLIFSYPKWDTDSTSVVNYFPPLAFFALIFVLVVLIKKIGKGPLVAILFFAGTLLPTLGFFNLYYMRYAFVADHFQYLACIGPIVFFSSSLKFLQKYNSGPSNKIKILASISPVFIFLIVSILSLLTWKQTHIYKNNETLWQDTLSKNPESGMAHNNLGMELRSQGKFELALDHFRKAAVLNPNFTEVHFNLGKAYQKNKNLSLAFSEFKKSIELDPSYYPSLNKLARVLAETGELNEALGYAEKCVKLSSSFAPGFNTLGNILEDIGKLDEAQTAYRKALKLDGTPYGTHLNLANVLYKQGSLIEAIPQYRKALSLNPNLVEAHYNLGNAFGQQGQLKEAKDSFKQAIKLDENIPLPHYGLGIIYKRLGERSQSIKAFEQALSLNPELSQAHYFLGEIYEKSEKKQKAIQHFNSAITLAEKNQNLTLKNNALLKLNTLSSN